MTHTPGCVEFPVTRITFSHDGRFLLLAGDQRASVPPLEGQGSVRSVTRIHSAAFCSEGKRLAVRELRAIVVLNVLTGEEIIRQSLPGLTAAVAGSRSGQVFLPDPESGLLMMDVDQLAD